MPREGRLPPVLGQATQRTTSKRTTPKAQANNSVQKSTSASSQRTSALLRHALQNGNPHARRITANNKDSNHLVSGRSRAEYEDLQYWRVLHLCRNIYNSATNRQGISPSNATDPRIQALTTPAPCTATASTVFRHVSMAAGRMREGESARVPQ